ncbi:hypothetical protein H2201_004394 [Coniosporium apollinis]|uniref:G-protein coupled receptors family 2 profile 2 domain-containing protein n=2 Tax=Coniosporium TaxID=2810619 RepID=A0ABQ9NZG2_9PEZI|nr:hypothetical protein H2199_004071 [Cladosporium sp. JES 115]KAJ9665512.1 hypothetical protein H2201_004394 [Coniosporium apollinis]
MPFDPSSSHGTAIETVERAMSILSILGTNFILGTFVAFPAFRKPINRLILYAAIGNALTNVATLISVSGIRYGEGSALCEFQGFLIQWFMPADSLWTLCMAFNVYLTFFKGHNAIDLRRLEKWYFLFCYGFPLPPPIIYLVLDYTKNRHGPRIYGPATLWCWVSTKWDWMRLTFFYGPVWVVIILTLSIYVATGRVIFKRRAQLRAFGKEHPHAPAPIIENPFALTDLSAVTKTTKIEVTTEVIELAPEACSSPVPFRPDSRSSYSSARPLSSAGTSAAPAPNHSYSRSWGQLDPELWACSAIITANTSRSHKHRTIMEPESPATSGEIMGDEEAAPARKSFSHTIRRRVANQGNEAAWAYAKVAMLMFIALVVVWV